MAPASMTGFGRAELDLGGVRLEVEVVSVNQKGLQILVFGPDAWPGLEAVAAGWVRARLHRGKVTARVTAPASAELPRQWDADAVVTSLAELQRIAARCGTALTPTGELLLRLAEASRRASVSLPAFAEAEAALQSAFGRALDGLTAMRQAEGSALAQDLGQRIARMSGQVAAMEVAERGAPARHRDGLLRRLKEAGLDLEVGDDRVLKELALFADRCDITEEVVRLRSHFTQFSVELAGVQGGRKLDFLIQELLREVNTIGSKASEIATTKLVLEAKTEIERIREQVQNLE